MFSWCTYLALLGSRGSSLDSLSPTPCARHAAQPHSPAISDSVRIGQDESWLAADIFLLEATISRTGTRWHW